MAAALALALFAAPVPAAVAPSKPPPTTDAPAPAPQAPDEAKPADAPAPPSPSSTDAPQRRGTDLGAWFESWIADSGMPVWAWAGLGLVAFLLLRGLFRRGDRRDLIGPPPSLRLGARPVAPKPRRPDPPQRL